MINVSTKEVKGRIYASPDKFTTKDGGSYLWFEYFGTGEYAEKGHIGTTEFFKESGGTMWLIPVDNAPKPLPYPIVTSSNVPGVEFYLAHRSKS